MTIQDAIKKAIEGGWKPNIIQDHHDLCSCGGEDIDHIAKKNKYVIPENQPDMILDPHFWQSLGSELSWGKSHNNHRIAPMEDGYQCKDCLQMVSKMDLKCKSKGRQWIYRWHQFIDHLAEGKTIEEYFNTL